MEAENVDCSVSESFFDHGYEDLTDVGIEVAFAGGVPVGGFDDECITF